MDIGSITRIDLEYALTLESSIRSSIRLFKTMVTVPEH